MNDDAVEAVARSLERFGAIAPIIVNEAFEVCAGHTRLKAAIEIGRKTFPVLVVPSLVGADFRGYNIADNQTASLAEWDNEGLAAALRELADEDFDLECLGFDGNELQELLAQTDGSQGRTDADEIPDPPDKPVTKTGDLWLLGDHRLLCGDATKAEDVNRVLDGCVPVLMVTDPPYGVNYDPAWRTREAEKGNLAYAARRISPISHDDRTDWGEAWNLFPGAVIYCWSPPGSNSIESGMALRASGFDIRYMIGHYHWRHEPCWYAVKVGQKALWVGDRKQTTVWEVTLDANVEGGHSTQKPVECMARPIRNHDAPEVYDPFLGSGTTIIAAEQLSRKCYGIEIEPRYVDVCCERFFRFSGKEPVRERGNAKWSNVKRAKRTTEDS
jgi:DNA modification methylase